MEWEVGAMALSKALPCQTHILHVCCSLNSVSTLPPRTQSDTPNQPVCWRGLRKDEVKPKPAPSFPRGPKWVTCRALLRFAYTSRSPSRGSLGLVVKQSSRSARFGKSRAEPWSNRFHPTYHDISRTVRDSVWNENISRHLSPSQEMILICIL